MPHGEEGVTALSSPLLCALFRLSSRVRHCRKRTEKPLRFMGNADSLPPVGQLPVKEAAPMEQFLLTLLANLAADVLAALIIRKWIK